MVTRLIDNLLNVVPNLINRLSNKHTGKGLLVIMTIIALEKGEDLDHIEQMFDGVEQDPLMLLFYAGVYLVIHYIQKK